MDAFFTVWRSVIIVVLLALVLMPKTSQARPIPSASQDSLQSMVSALLSAGYPQFAREIQHSIQIHMPADCGFTFFAPTDAALSQADPLLYNKSLLYHVVVGNIQYDILRELDAGTRLQTLLRNKSVVISTATPAMIRVNDVRVAVPDLYKDGSCFTVHGVEHTLKLACSRAFDRRTGSCPKYSVGHMKNVKESPARLRHPEPGMLGHTSPGAPPKITDPSLYPPALPNIWNTSICPPAHSPPTPTTLLRPPTAPPPLTLPPQPALPTPPSTAATTSPASPPSIVALWPPAAVSPPRPAMHPPAPTPTPLSPPPHATTLLPKPPSAATSPPPQAVRATTPTTMPLSPPVVLAPISNPAGNTPPPPASVLWPPPVTVLWPKQAPPPQIFIPSSQPSPTSSSSDLVPCSPRLLSPPAIEKVSGSSSLDQSVKSLNSTIIISLFLVLACHLRIF